MALDEALLNGLAEGWSEPALRFYDWDPPALSLGYSQDAADVDFDACERLGVDVVRRPTGGRAVLHTAELTYGVTLPAGKESIAQSYCRISQAIARGISRLGVTAALELGKVAPPTSRSADCFAASTAADLVAAGRKIVGSAQVRRRGVLLQHGSIKLEPPSVRIGQVLLGAHRSETPATLAELLGQPASTFLPRLKRLIAEELGVEWRPSGPTSQEIETAQAIESTGSSRSRNQSLRTRPDRLGARSSQED